MKGEGLSVSWNVHIEANVLSELDRIGLRYFGYWNHVVEQRGHLKGIREIGGLPGEEGDVHDGIVGEEEGRGKSQYSGGCEGLVQGMVMKSRKSSSW